MKPLDYTPPKCPAYKPELPVSVTNPDVCVACGYCDYCQSYNEQTCDGCGVNFEPIELTKQQIT